MNTPTTATRRTKPRNLALDVVDVLIERVRAGSLAVGAKLPTEAAIMDEFGVSRTVVREALSKLQASGVVQTRHGVGTFVVGLGEASAFRIGPEQLATLRDVIAVLELRIGLETESAGLAAVRRSDANLVAMRQALDEFAAAVTAGLDAVTADFAFHSEIARATQNPHFTDLISALGMAAIPRARLDPAHTDDAERLAYLRRVNGEHESIYDAIAAQDPEAARAAMRTHLANSRERRRRAAALAGDA
ncbi:FadR/GntR family transcriptional regulator [Piscinibacter gummiphilus]|uniref:GntR family transcriptional regulator n=1 Tax=Piscinibacter gummiphilus TaxID=946333 RepID=A0A1W6LGF9_9BURK|nr:FadR/GntR family transcriptional regulator [Piscinibacter gummiphilus]ARN23298.1 GntR family transcriptional regulator [Piscinibacter gummiphilus]ATU67999.1 FadR family transcriptional regulator [Piscinibacter gummiphilus]GLS97292.1 GntR family transcriptional regulator [Piscinibacter gummiphilus]